MLSLLSRASDNTWRAIPALKSGWKTSKNTHDFRLDFNNLSFGFSGCGWLIPVKDDTLFSYNFSTT